MKKNMGNVDRVIRILVALLVVILYFTHVITGTLAVILLILAAIFVVTSFIGFCHLYVLFGFNTVKKVQK